MGAINSSALKRSPSNSSDWSWDKVVVVVVVVVRGVLSRGCFSFLPPVCSVLCAAFLSVLMVGFLDLFLFYSIWIPSSLSSLLSFASFSFAGEEKGKESDPADYFRTVVVANDGLSVFLELLTSQRFIDQEPKSPDHVEVGVLLLLLSLPLFSSSLLRPLENIADHECSLNAKCTLKGR